MHNNKIMLVLIVSLFIVPVQAYTINEPLNEYEFNHFRMNITFDSVAEKNKIIANISHDMKANIINFSFINMGGLTFIATAQLKNYSQKINLFCGTCSIWYANSSWESKVIYNVTQGCKNCVANITTQFNTSDRWINESDLTLINFYRQTSNGKIYLNLTENGSYQIAKYINASNFYGTLSNPATTFIQYSGYTTSNTFVNNNVSLPFIYETNQSIGTSGWSEWGISDTNCGSSCVNGILEGSRYVVGAYYIDTYKASANTESNLGALWTANQWYQPLIFANSTNIIYYTTYRNGSTNQITTNIPVVQLGINFYNVVGSSGIQDYAFLRKWTLTEPIITLYQQQYYPYPTLKLRIFSYVIG